MKSKTQLKLEEALFFLKKMEKNFNLDPDFDFYFNAFISSGRSVTFVMQKEYSKAHGFKEWYENRVLNEKENTLLKKISMDLRNTSIHLESLKTSIEYVVVIPDNFNLDKDKKYKIFLSNNEFKDNGINTEKPFFRSKIHTLRVLKEEDISNERDKDNKVKNSDNDIFMEYHSKPKKLYDLENNVIYLSWEYYNWLNDIVTGCESLFIRE